MQFRPTLEKGKAADGIGRGAMSILDADIKILPSRLSELDSNPAATMKVAAGEAHVSAQRAVLRVEIDVPREWQ